MRYILIADVGTTSMKTSLFTRDLRCLGTIAGEYKLRSLPNGVIELDPEAYWTQFCQGTRQICEHCGVTPDQIERIGITTQGETIIPVDGTGRALRDAIVWLDTRAQAESCMIASQIDMDIFRRNTGIADMTAVWPLCKLLWIKGHEPEVYQRTAYFLLLEDYLILRLTGRFVSNKGVSCTTGYYDILHDRLWTEILEQFALDPDKIPEILDCGTPVGTVEPAVCAALGFASDTLVVTTAMDQVSSAIGSGSAQEGVFTETTGTVVAIAVTGDRQALLSPRPVTTYWHALRDKYLICPICMTGGMVLKWYKDELCQAEQQEAARRGISVYSLLDEQAEKSPPMSNGLLTIPYFNGSLQPSFRPQARGVIFGLGLENTQSDITRSILESIAFMLRENVEMIAEQCGLTPRQLRCCGGGGSSSVWNQIKADVCGLPACSLVNHETTSLGAAAVSLFPEYGEEQVLALLDKTILIRQTYVPSPERHQLYTSGYRRYQALFQALADQFG